MVQPGFNPLSEHTMSPRSSEDQGSGLAWGTLVRWTGVGLAALALGLAVAQPGPHALKVGETAPPMRLASLDGDTVDLGPFRGKPMFLNFFATWCGPCRMEIPELNLAHDALGERVPVVGVLVLSGLPPDVKSKVTPMGIRYPVWVTDDESAAGWHIDAVPVTVLVDAQGKLAWISNGTVNQRELADAMKHVGLRADAPVSTPAPVATLP